MRISDLYGDLFEGVSAPGGKDSGQGLGKISKGLPPSFQHSMPDTHSFPDMDANYGFYRFVVAMAGMPEKNEVETEIALRDIPIAVAYTQQEHDMIHAAAKRMGIQPTELAYHGSHELPDTYTVSPVMKFHMPESQQRKLRDALALSEAMLDASK